jgi:hypothetical protein
MEINLQPSDRDLRWFGLIVLLFCGFIAATIWWVSGETAVAIVLAAVGGVLCGLYYAVKPLRRTLYLRWMRAVFPLGWAMSHALIGLVYFAVVTPVGWILRLAGKDPMKRTLLRNAPSYWVERQSRPDPARYFNQY